MSLQLDTLAYTNRLRNIPSIAKIIFSLVNLAIALFCHPPVQICIALWMSFCTVMYAKIPLRIYLRLLTIASIFLLMSLPALIINFVDLQDNFQQSQLLQNDVYWGIHLNKYYIYISWHGLQQAFTILSRSFACVSCLYFLILSVPFTDILEVLRRCGLPILITELLLLMYRFIFVLLRTANQLWIAQNSRCGYRTRTRGIKSFALLVGQLLQRTLQQYQQFSQGLETRGFKGEFRVCHFRRDHFPENLPGSVSAKRLYKRYMIEGITSWIIFILLEIFYVRFYL